LLEVRCLHFLLKIECMNDCPHVHEEENIFAFDVVQREIFYLVKSVFFINYFLDIIFILGTVVVYVIEGFITGFINLLGCPTLLLSTIEPSRGGNGSV